MVGVGVADPNLIDVWKDGQQIVLSALEAWIDDDRTRQSQRRHVDMTVRGAPNSLAVRSHAPRKSKGNVYLGPTRPRLPPWYGRRLTPISARQFISQNCHRLGRYCYGKEHVAVRELKAL